MTTVKNRIWNTNKLEAEPKAKQMKAYKGEFFERLALVGEL